MGWKEEGKKKQGGKREYSSKESTMNQKLLTDDHRADRWMIQDPTSGNIRDTRAAVTLTNATQDDQEFLKQCPGAPRFQDEVKVLSCSGRKRRSM
jgi:hypothetical protein